LKRRVFVLFEQGPELSSQCSGHIRLLRPLSYPTLAERIELASGRRFDGGRYDAVIIERLWRGGVTLPLVEELVAAIRKTGARIIYAQDDNMFDLREGMAGQEWLTEKYLSIMSYLQSQSVGILVSTERLKARLSPYHPRIVVVPNALDERLIASSPARRSSGEGRLVVGYMGTRSHDEDVQMILPALEAAHERFGDRLEIQLVGALAREEETRATFGRLPIRVVSPSRHDADYPLFFSWFTGTIRWDVGLAPLRDNAYNACKSDIKWLDYTAIGAAGLYSRLPPYSTVEDGETGSLADNTPEVWRDGLVRLLGDSALRAKMVRQARARLFTTRTLRHCAHRWADALDELLA
jgi:glycosyltransferase involved in cell wall biosynthesis